MELALLLLALIGHAYLWATFFNYTHSTAWPRWIIDPTTAAGFGAAVLIPIALVVWPFWGGFVPMLPSTEIGALAWLGRLYLGVCTVAGARAAFCWVRRVGSRPPELVRHQRTQRHRPLKACGPSLPPDGDHRLLTRLPGNQILQLEVNERAMELPRLAPGLDGLVIAHLSDLHWTGRVPRAYFEEVVRLANGFSPDLVAITGDLIDNPECMDWVPSTLGQLQGRFGAYFVLGNHDLRVDTERLRRTLIDCGLIDLGGRWVKVAIRGEPVILGGNELPWIPPAADLAQAPPASSNRRALRIVLAHCPDQLRWARAHQVDLMLAGHTHGGQICLPVVGPLLSASQLGARYCWGTFHEPPTVMHVTRGVSARFPLRIACPPELVKLVLRTPRSR